MGTHIIYVSSHTLLVTTQLCELDLYFLVYNSKTNKNINADTKEFLVNKWVTMNEFPRKHEWKRTSRIAAKISHSIQATLSLIKNLVYELWNTN